MAEPTATPTRKFMTRAEAAAYITATYFKISKRTLSVWATEDRGPAYRRIAGQAHYTKADIDAWVLDDPENYGTVEPGSRTTAAKPAGGALATTARR